MCYDIIIDIIVSIILMPNAIISRGGVRRLLHVVAGQRKPIFLPHGRLESPGDTHHGFRTLCVWNPSDQIPQDQKDHRSRKRYLQPRLRLCTLAVTPLWRA